MCDNCIMLVVGSMLVLGIHVTRISRSFFFSRGLGEVGRAQMLFKTFTTHHLLREKQLSCKPLPALVN